MRQRPTLELLEPRILYSADTPSALAGALVGTPDAEHRLLDADGEFAAQTAPQEIVFIDARTPESAQLVEDIEAQSARQVEVIVLDAERNGLEQISEALAGRESVAALHFIAHGAEGVMQLGNTLVTADSLERNPSLVQAWSDVLTADADILLYGCDIAATAEGRLLADTLGRLTGADVSASDDATGHASLGGDWTLEYATGTIDVPVATSASTQDAWTHLLPSVVLTSYEPPFADMTDNAYELGGGTTYAQTFSYDSPGATYTVNQIDLVLYSDGGAGGADVDIQLRSALGGGGSNLLASGSVSRAGLTTSESWVSVFLDSTVTLTDNATYYIVIGGGGGGGIFVGIANTDGYSGGNAFIGSTAHTDKDIAFRVGFSDAPVLDLNGIPSGHDTSANFTEQTPVRIAMNATIADPDSTDLTSLTATLTARPDGDAVELLSLNLNASDAADNEGLSVSYDQATGALSITGLASVDTYEEILQGILYNNTSDAPTTTDRTITVVVTDDGGTQSTARTSIIRITGLVNDAPVNNVPGAQTTNEDTALVFSAGPGNAISITDDATNPVRVSLSSTNGTLTLAGTAGLTFSAGDGTADATMTFTGTVAAINAALEGMSFMPNAEFSGAALLSINTNDLGNTGTGGALSDSDTVAITVNAVNDAPVIAGAGGTLLYTEGDAATVIDGTLTPSDVDNTTLASATVTISAGLVSAEDVLSFTTAFGITGSYTAATGVLVLSGSATLAQYEQVLESVTYQNTNTFDPSTGGRTITWVVNDGADNSAGVTSTITLAAVNDAPVNAVPGAQATNEDTVLVFSGGNAISIADDAGANPVQLTLSGTNGVITLAGTTGLTFSAGDGTADGTMTFSGTVTAINTALNGLSFTPDANFNGAASLSINANDQGNTGAGGPLSDLDVVAITVNAMNDAPVNTVPGAQATNEDTVLVFSSISITDVDAGASPVQVSLTGTNGLITLAGTAGLTFSMGDGTTDGTMTFTGTVAAINAALNGLSFLPDANFNGAAALSVNTSDQGNTGAGGVLADLDAVTITVNAVNDAPVIAGASGTLAYTEDDLATFIDTDLTLSDVDDVNIESATVTISAGFVSAEDVLDFTAGFGITGTYNSTTGVLTLSGSAMLAEYEQVLESVTYQNTNTGDPNTGARTINWVVNDGTDNSAAVTSTITVAPVNDAPVNTVPAAQIIDEDTALVLSGGNAISITDVDAGGSPLQVTLTGTNGVITLAGTAGLTFSLGDGTADGTMTFTGTAAAINAALNGLSFAPAANFNGAASLAVNTSDQGNTGAGGALSDLDAVAITVSAVNDAPVNTVPPAQTIDEDTVLVLSGSDAISITDLDAGASPVQVSLSGTNGVITLATTAGLIFSLGDGTADSTMTFSGTVAAINAALNGLSFAPTANFNGAAALSVNTSDQANTGAGGVLSDLDAVTITVNAVNDAPVVTGAGGTLPYTEDDSATFIDTDLTLSDVDDVNIESATVTISAGLVSAEDVLDFTAVAGINGSYNAATGVLTLSGSATLAEYEQVLESVTYQNTNTGNPSIVARTITWVVNDGTDNSADVTSTITVAAVNDAPVIVGAGGTLSYTEGDAATLIDATLALSDVDDVNIESATVTISGGLVSAEDVLSFTSGFGITGTYTAATGVLALSGSATLSQYEQVLESVTYQNTNNANPNTGARTITWVVNDSTDNSAGVTSTITLAAVNDAPVNNVPGAQSTNEDTALVLSGGNAISITDDAGTNPVQVTLSGTNGVITLSGTAGLSFSLGDGTADGTMTFSGTVAAINAALDGLSFAPTANFDGAGSLSISTNDQGNTGAGGALSDLDVVAISVNAVNDAPVNTVPGAQTAYEDTVFVLSSGNGNAISVADLDAGTSPLQVVLTGTNGAITLAGIAGLTFSVGDGVADGTMTFTGTAAAINAALNGLSFLPNANFSGAASLAVDTNDQGNTGAGGTLSDSDVVAVNVLANVAPTVSASGGTTVFTEGSNVASTPVVVDGALTVSDPDSATLATATMSIGAGWQAAEDSLAFASNPATMGNITGSYNDATGVLNLSSAGATATLGQWQAALRSVTYTNTSDTPNTAARTVSFVVSGQGGTSAVSTQQVAVTAVNDAPTVSASGGTTGFTGGASPVVVDAAIGLNDLDNATLAGATVWISGGFQAGQDVIGFSNNPATMGNIAGSYNAASGMLTLSSAGASATLSQWQAALRSVTYGNTSATPIVGARAVSFDVSDGTAGAMAAATHLVDVSPNPAPPDPGPIVPPPPPVIPPVVVGPPPVTPPPTTTPPPSTQTTAPTGGPAGPAVSEASAEAPIQPVTVDIAERPHNPMAEVVSANQSNVGTAPAWRLAVFGTSVQGVELAGGDLLGEMTRQSDSRGATGLSQSGERSRSPGEVELSGDLESLRENLREQDEIQTRGTVALAAGSLSMTLAYLLWLVRGGALVASALSALPAWRILDPLPVLSRVSDDDEDEGDEDDDQAIASFTDEPFGARQ